MARENEEIVYVDVRDGKKREEQKLRAMQAISQTMCVQQGGRRRRDAKNNVI